ncbi:DUF1801 domain-containing protein [Chondromyces apiculatus]|uniref:Leucyl-tRNA synthetase n=1 Tax=Chondromyces apiculatus DSM 436 TaxID=1192034 RepID=A0A017T6D4_9BACT|nr:DUF1801 domain-containing protein [Chondromyces apiculatus]EYF04794.1 leucyl-tRNA synthetase [Chondromyces apiculatus DSM 436]
MKHPIDDYNDAQEPSRRAICAALAARINEALPKAESKVWHGGPVWFLAGNPVVGYWVRKSAVQLLFWSGQSFDEPGLEPEGKFKAAHVHYDDVSEVDPKALERWLRKAETIQWDYKNIVKRRGVLEKLGDW